MARTPGTRFVHILRELKKTSDGQPRQHDLFSGNECWCEPQCARVNGAVLVVHDPDNEITLVDDKGIADRGSDPKGIW